MNDRFGSTARDFAVDIVTREGGTPEDVRESFADPDLDRIASDLDWLQCIRQSDEGRMT
ncbi:hypothetical protein [Bifidobacterium adolescentis]|uniref:Uncharacterized protein n=1 Tax=Bifidobacterium adolescentis L2-32 TaxID=411481 RepID=A7A866_BIFAD|nr:hypothetical protein [Bifidobacterium adolescentis]EDN81931.1 hypothetical protein BIFADO_02056 [Bifidobacterium adolescentis L2-32]